ncbi:hypothetical protein PTKIN_Ptkin09bG0170700 [Pterospermum kingtungense]
MNREEDAKTWRILLLGCLNLIVETVQWKHLGGLWLCRATSLLGPPASFEASKLKIVFKGDGLKNYSVIIPRAYILSHCDFTANLTLTISNVINLDQLKGWYKKDDVVAEWKKVKEAMFLNVHCFVRGPNLLLDLAAEFRYHIFSKELPLVLKAVLHGDSVLFTEHPELMDAVVCVCFHSSLPKYNIMECIIALYEMTISSNSSTSNIYVHQGKLGDQVQGLLSADKESSSSPAKWGRSPKSIFQALFTFLL